MNLPNADERKQLEDKAQMLKDRLIRKGSFRKESATTTLVPGSSSGSQATSSPQRFNIAGGSREQEEDKAARNVRDLAEAVQSEADVATEDTSKRQRTEGTLCSHCRCTRCQQLQLQQLPTIAEEAVGAEVVQGQQSRIPYTPNRSADLDTFHFKCSQTADPSNAGEEWLKIDGSIDGSDSVRTRWSTMEGFARAWDHVRALTDRGGSYEMVMIFKPLPAVSGKGQKSKGEPEADVPDPADDMDWELVALDDTKHHGRYSDDIGNGWQAVDQRMAREGRRARRADGTSPIVTSGCDAELYPREVEEDKNTPM